MVDETRPNPFKKDGDAPKTTDPDANATATTTPVADGEQPAAEVSDAEASALDGAGGPNRTPAFTKRDGEDENTQLTDTDDLASAKSGAAAHTGSQVDLVGLEAAALAGDEVPEGHEDTVQFTSTPIASLRLGRFQFENGVLRLSAEDADVFEKLLSGAAIRTQQVVRRIDRQGGEAVARRYLDTVKSRSNAGVDTSDRGNRAPQPTEQQHA